ncbi:unnamed protein product [Heterobilharzia americana]|nr:unnamed protein product [Heterobilharzia americana]
MSSNLEAPPLMRKLLIGQLFQNADRLPVYNSIRQIWEMDIMEDGILMKLSWCMLWLQGRITKCYHPTNCNFLLDDGTGEMLIVYELNKSQCINYKPNIGDYVAVVGKLCQADEDSKNETFNCWHILAKSVTKLGSQAVQIGQCESLSQKEVSNSAIYELSWPLEVVDMMYSL